MRLDRPVIDGKRNLSIGDVDAAQRVFQACIGNLCRGGDLDVAPLDILLERDAEIDRHRRPALKFREIETALLDEIEGVESHILEGGGDVGFRVDGELGGSDGGEQLRHIHAACLQLHGAAGRQGDDALVHRDREMVSLQQRRSGGIGDGRQIGEILRRDARKFEARVDRLVGYELGAQRRIESADRKIDTELSVLDRPAEYVRRDPIARFGRDDGRPEFLHDGRRHVTDAAREPDADRIGPSGKAAMDAKTRPSRHDHEVLDLEMSSADRRHAPELDAVDRERVADRA